MDIFPFIVSTVLPPVLVPRQSEYPRPPPPLPSPFRSAEDPPMPYNASFPFQNRQNQLDHSANTFDMPGDERFLFVLLFLRFAPFCSYFSLRRLQYSILELVLFLGNIYKCNFWAIFQDFLVRVFFFSSQKWTMHVLALKKLILGLGF